MPALLQSLGFNNLDRSATESQQLYRMLLAGRTSPTAHREAETAKAHRG